MKISSGRVLACALAFTLFAGLAQAAEPQPPAGHAAAADPEAEALVRRYLAAVHFERNMDNMQAAMLPVVAEQAARQSPSLTAEDRQAIVDIVRSVIRERMMPQMIERMVPLYAQTFSIEELKGLVAFYESPVGRSITDKLPALAPKGAEITRELLPGVQAEVLRRIVVEMCAKHACGAKASPKPSAS